MNMNQSEIDKFLQTTREAVEKNYDIELPVLAKITGRRWEELSAEEQENGWAKFHLDEYTWDTELLLQNEILLMHLSHFYPQTLDAGVKRELVQAGITEDVLEYTSAKARIAKAIDGYLVYKGLVLEIAVFRLDNIGWMDNSKFKHSWDITEKIPRPINISLDNSQRYCPWCDALMYGEMGICKACGKRSYGKTR